MKGLDGVVAKKKRADGEAGVACGCAGNGKNQDAFEGRLVGLRAMNTDPEVVLQVIEEAVKKERGRGLESWEREKVLCCLQAMHEKYKREAG